MGLKSIPIEAFPPGYWRVLEGKLEESNGISVVHAYKYVPVMRQSIDIRANAVAGMPYLIMRGDQDVSLEPEIIKFMTMLRPLLRKIESDLCLFGAAYLLIERNRFGLNGRLRPLSPVTIEPQYDDKLGVKEFIRTINDKTYTIKPDEMVYFWLQNPDAEVGPGVAPATTALRSAATLYFLDTFLENFWRRGAIKATLLSVSGPAQQAEMQKLEAWWKRFVSGVKNSWNSVAIRADVKPVVVGDTLRDTVNPDLTEQSRTDTLTAFGVPHSLVLSNAATYATANVDRLAFYESTIVPQCTMICEVLNEQLLYKAGLRIIPRPDKLETYQRNELEKAQGVIQLTGSPILTVNEARDMMGYGPIQQAPMNIDDKFDEPQETINATAPALREESPTSPVSQQINGQSAKQLDLMRWKHKAIKSLKSGKSPSVRFDSDEIPFAEKKLLEQLLIGQDVHAVKHIFDSFKRAPGESLTDDEQQLYDILVKAMTKIRREAMASGRTLNAEEFAQKLGAEVASALRLTMNTTYQQLIAEAVSRLGVGVDPLELALAIAPEWDSYVDNRRKQIEDTTRRYLAMYVDSTTTDSVIELAFGNRRAEVIAITENTNSQAMVIMKLQELLQQMGVATKLIWITAQDELVCTKCRPFNRTSQDVWKVPPPLHPYCRCTLVLERA
jgi:phage portal protein BeeE/flagellar motor component MotA